MAAGVKAAIITISTSAAAADREDVSGPVLAEAVAAAGAEVVARDLIPDDRELIEQTLRRHSAPDAGIALIFTTGGTGLTVTTARATARRSVAGFSDTSTIRARPAASRWVSGDLSGIAITT